MMTVEKKNLINECLRLSKAFPGKIAYGFIEKSGHYTPTINEWIIKECILEKAKIYCKAQNGQLIL